MYSFHELDVADNPTVIFRGIVESHLGYAVSQIKKARGCNKRVWNPWPEEPPKPEDYADAGAYQHALKEHRVVFRSVKHGLSVK